MIERILMIKNHDTHSAQAIYEALLKDPDLEIKEGQTREEAAKIEAEFRTRQYFNNMQALALGSEPSGAIKSLINFVSTPVSWVHEMLNIIKEAGSVYQHKHGQVGDKEDDQLDLKTNHSSIDSDGNEVDVLTDEGKEFMGIVNSLSGSLKIPASGIAFLADAIKTHIKTYPDSPDGWIKGILHGLQSPTQGAAIRDKLGLGENEAKKFINHLEIHQQDWPVQQNFNDYKGSTIDYERFENGGYGSGTSKLLLESGSSIDKINKVLASMGRDERIQFGSTNKLKFEDNSGNVKQWKDFGEYGRVRLLHKHIDPNHFSKDDADGGAITLEQLGKYTVAEVLKGFFHHTEQDNGWHDVNEKQKDQLQEKIDEHQENLKTFSENQPTASEILEKYPDKFESIDDDELEDIFHNFGKKDPAHKIDKSLKFSLNNYTMRYLQGASVQGEAEKQKVENLIADMKKADHLLNKMNLVDDHGYLHTDFMMHLYDAIKNKKISSKNIFKGKHDDGSTSHYCLIPHANSGKSGLDELLAHVEEAIGHPVLPVMSSEVAEHLTKDTPTGDALIQHQFETADEHPPLGVPSHTRDEIDELSEDLNVSDEDAHEYDHPNPFQPATAYFQDLLNKSQDYASILNNPAAESATPGTDVNVHETMKEYLADNVKKMKETWDSWYGKMSTSPEEVTNKAKLISSIQNDMAEHMIKNQALAHILLNDDLPPTLFNKEAFLNDQSVTHPVAKGMKDLLDGVKELSNLDNYDSNEALYNENHSAKVANAVNKIKSGLLKLKQGTQSSPSYIADAIGKNWNGVDNYFVNDAVTSLMGGLNAESWADISDDEIHNMDVFGTFHNAVVSDGHEGLDEDTIAEINNIKVSNVVKPVDKDLIKQIEGGSFPEANITEIAKMLRNTLKNAQEDGIFNPTHASDMENNPSYIADMLLDSIRVDLEEHPELYPHALHHIMSVVGEAYKQAKFLDTASSKGNFDETEFPVSNVVSNMNHHIKTRLEMRNDISPEMADKAELYDAIRTHIKAKTNTEFNSPDAFHTQTMLDKLLKSKDSVYNGMNSIESTAQFKKDLLDWFGSPPPNTPLGDYMGKITDTLEHYHQQSDKSDSGDPSFTYDDDFNGYNSIHHEAMKTDPVYAKAFEKSYPDLSEAWVSDNGNHAGMDTATSEVDDGTLAPDRQSKPTSSNRMNELKTQYDLLNHIQDAMLGPGKAEAVKQGKDVDDLHDEYIQNLNDIISDMQTDGVSDKDIKDTIKNIGGGVGDTDFLLSNLPIFSEEPPSDEEPTTEETTDEPKPDEVVPPKPADEEAPPPPGDEDETGEEEPDERTKQEIMNELFGDDQDSKAAQKYKKYLDKQDAKKIDSLHEKHVIGAIERNAQKAKQEKVVAEQQAQKEQEQKEKEEKANKEEEAGVLPHDAKGVEDKIKEGESPKKIMRDLMAHKKNLGEHMSPKDMKDHQDAMDAVSKHMKDHHWGELDDEEQKHGDDVYGENHMKEAEEQDAKDKKIEESYKNHIESDDDEHVGNRQNAFDQGEPGKFTEFDEEGKPKKDHHLALDKHGESSFEEHEHGKGPKSPILVNPLGKFFDENGRPLGQGVLHDEDEEGSDLGGGEDTPKTGPPDPEVARKKMLEGYVWHEETRHWIKKESLDQLKKGLSGPNHATAIHSDAQIQTPGQAVHDNPFAVDEHGNATDSNFVLHNGGLHQVGSASEKAPQYSNNNHSKKAALGHALKGNLPNKGSVQNLGSNALHSSGVLGKVGIAGGKHHNANPAPKPAGVKQSFLDGYKEGKGDALPKWAGKPPKGKGGGFLGLFKEDTDTDSALEELVRKYK